MDMNRDLLDLTNGFPEDYHDYVIKDGRLIGAFDEMYRHSKDVPWGQDERCNHWYTESGLLMLRDEGPFGSILEIGCGLGYITHKLRRIAASKDATIHGFDISPEAARKASELHPGIDFWADDVTRADYEPRRQYDLVVVRDVFWYIFESMERVVANIARSVRTGGRLYICQSFPALDRPFVGKQTIPNPDALLDLFSKDFTLIHTMLLRRHRVTSDGPIIQFLTERNA